MNDYQETFCKEVINDTSATESYIGMVGEMLNDSFSSYSDKANFIKDNLDHTDGDHVSGLVYEFGGDIDEFSLIFNINMDYASEIEEKRNIWENTDFESEFEEKLEELNAEDDDDEDDEDEDW